MSRLLPGDWMALRQRAAAAGWAIGAASLVAAGPGAAQTAAKFPAKPIRIVVPFAPGGANDTIARMVGQKLSEQWGQPAVIENRGGAGGTIGVDAVAKSPPDGYTIALGGSSNLTVAPNLYPRMPYHTLRDLAPIASAAVTPYLVTVNPHVPATSIADLIRIARLKKDFLSYGSSGAGSMSHLGVEMFKAAIGAAIVHVPYKGTAPAVTAMIAGEIDMMIADVLAVEPHSRAGKLRPLAATGTRRTSIMPELPTMIEAGFTDFKIEGKFGFVAPAGTPRDIVAKLNAGIVAALTSPEVKQRFDKLGYEATIDTPEQFAASLKADIEMYGRLIRRAGITADL